MDKADTIHTLPTLAKESGVSHDTIHKENLNLPGAGNFFDVVCIDPPWAYEEKVGCASHFLDIYNTDKKNQRRKKMKQLWMRFFNSRWYLPIVTVIMCIGLVGLIIF